MESNSEVNNCEYYTKRIYTDNEYSKDILGTFSSRETAKSERRKEDKWEFHNDAHISDEILPPSFVLYNNFNTVTMHSNVWYSTATPWLE